MAHLSVAFGQPDFAGMLPALYKPTDEHMGRNYAVRRGGRIAAIVGLFPIDWVIGGERLRLAGIGGVSVHPDHRGQGLMRLLMDEVMREVERGGYQAACLGGNRRRYAYWGFEKAGVEASFVVTPNSVEHANGGRWPERTVPPDEAKGGDLAAMRALYEAQPIRCDRDAERFADHLRHWRRAPLVVRNDRGAVAAYGCVDPRDDSCVELCARDERSAGEFVARYVMSSGRPMRIAAPLLRTPVVRSIEGLTDDASVIEASNWRFYDWPAVVGALLRVKHAASPLVNGSVVVCIEGAAGMPGRFRMTVDGGAGCGWTDDEPGVSGCAASLTRMLMGPLGMGLPTGETPLAGWRPLPLMIPMQDRI